MTDAELHAELIRRNQRMAELLADLDKEIAHSKQILTTLEHHKLSVREPVLVKDKNNVTYPSEMI